jgi:tripartite-type tricarboxylate transporter receptor subunit TctC
MSFFHAIAFPAPRASRSWLAACLAGIGLLAAPATMQAQQFPVKPIRIVVPFAAGGGTDLIARVMGQGMAQDLGQPVIVDNKPGGGTILGTDLVAKSPPDGYTLVLATFAHAVNPSLQAHLPYDTAKAFAPISLVGRSPNVLVVRPDRPYKSVNDLLAEARARPGKLTYGSYGNGTSAHLAAELLKNLAKVDITHIPYRGSSPAITDLLGGQIDMMLTTISSAAAYLDGGKLRALAVTSATRSPAYPDVPTLAEAGVKGYLAESWYGLYAPAGTPPEVIARLNQAVKAATATEAFRKRVENEGLVVSAGPPQELDRYVGAEIERWKKIVQDAHIKAD